MIITFITSTSSATYSFRRNAAIARCQECSASFSFLFPSARYVCRKIFFTLSISIKKAICCFILSILDTLFLYFPTFYTGSYTADCTLFKRLVQPILPDKITTRSANFSSSFLLKHPGKHHTGCNSGKCSNQCSR